MIGWTLLALLVIGVLAGLTWAIKGIDGNWGKAALVVAAITAGTLILCTSIYGAVAMIEAGI